MGEDDQLNYDCSYVLVFKHLDIFQVVAIALIIFCTVGLGNRLKILVNNIVILATICCGIFCTS